MLGLTTLGLFHTAISLVSVVSAVSSFFRSGRISGRDMLGQIYVWTTAITCLTAFGIFQHGGFGKPHALAVLTLLTLVLAAIAERTRSFRSLSIYVATVSYTATFLFHMIPAATETLTRMPASAPVFANADAPGLQKVTGIFLLVFLLGVAWQIRKLRAERDDAKVFHNGVGGTVPHRR